MQKGKRTWVDEANDELYAELLLKDIFVGVDAISLCGPHLVVLEQGILSLFLALAKGGAEILGP